MSVLDAADEDDAEITAAIGTSAVAGILDDVIDELMIHCC